MLQECQNPSESHQTHKSQPTDPLTNIPPKIVKNETNKPSPPKFRQKPVQKKGKYNQSVWTLVENTKYLQFLIKNRHLVEQTAENKGKNKLNKCMSKQVKSRSSQQCRSHHQKMLKYHITIQGIVEYVTALQQKIKTEELTHSPQTPTTIRKRLRRVKKDETEVHEQSSNNQSSLWVVIEKQFLQSSFTI